MLYYNGLYVHKTRLQRTKGFYHATCTVQVLLSLRLKVGGIYEKMAKLGLRYFLKVITVLETL